jgi:multicomponent Na+:H+ antiporter subunit D
MVRSAPAVAVLFLVPALALAGIPPLSGFLPKFALVDAGLAADQPIIVGISLVVSLLTVFSLVKIWSGVFWNPADDPPDLQPYDTGRLGGPALMVVPTAVLLVVGLAIAAAGSPLYELSQRAAIDLLDTQTYIDAVLGGAG